jgi:chromate transporter
MSDKGSRLWALFTIFFNLSALTLGGGLAMLPLIHREFVERRKWMSNEAMVDCVAVMQAMPGIIAMNMGVLIGHQIAGIKGALAAVSGAFLPPFFAIILLASLFMKLQDNAIVAQVFTGVRAAVCALILLAVIKLVKEIIKGPFEIIVTLLCFAALIFTNVNAVWLIVFGTLSGFLLFAARALHQGINKVEKNEK